MVGIGPDGTALILGVVSHRLTGGDEWYFAAIGASLPWPDAAEAAGAGAPAIATITEADLSTIQRLKN